MTGVDFFGRNTMFARLLILLLCAGLFPATSAHAVEPVSRTQSRLLPQGEVVYDRKTDLTWQRCTYGQRWVRNKGCTGESKRITFDEAKALERDGWRVPTLDELKSIVVKGVKPTIDTAAFPDTPPVYFWSTDNRDTSFSWYVLFENGVANHYFPPRTNKDRVRLVRSGRWLPAAARQP